MTGKGPLVKVTPEWVEAAKAAQRERGWNDRELAEAASTSKTNIHRLWASTQHRDVVPVSNALGIPPPFEQRLLDAAAALRTNGQPDALGTLAQMAEQLAALAGQR